MEQTFKGSNLQMLNLTFEMFILHYIMEYVGNLCSPCLLSEQPKSEFSCTMQLCIIALLLEESILQVTLVHVLSLT